MSDYTTSERYTDTGNAERLVRRHGDKLRHVYQWGWHVWDGRRWVRDTTNQAIELAKETIRNMYREAAELPDALRGAHVDWATRSEGLFKLKAMVELAQSDPKIAASTEQFDADPWALNVLNGTLDLRTGELKPHKPADLITKLAPVNYSPEAKSADWEQFLDGVFESDKEMIAFIQRAIGYSLTGSVREPAFFIPWGSGRNGKSSLLNAVKRVMGDYSEATHKQTFLRKERSGGIPNDVARLAGARMVLTSETEQGERLDISLIKQVTGGDPITARYLNAEWFTYQPQMKVWLATNNKPEIPETSPAMRARVKLIPFEACFIGREDPDMKDKLEAAAEAILAWAVEGCCKWQMEKLNEPEKVKAATQKYWDEQNALADFLEETCVLGAGLRAQSRPLYNRYKEWCSNTGERPLSDKEFSNQLEQHGLTKKKSNGVMCWLGIGLASEQHGGTFRNTLHVVNGTDEENEDIPF